MVNQSRARLDKIAIVVDDYDQAIEFFTKALVVLC
jgi:catechol 2,3-dioxygenase-like lactoylglutathione lyase family enzyme